MGRVLTFFVGLLIAGLGWAIHDPTFVAGLGALSPYLPTPIPLGPGESYRTAVAAAVGVLGLLLLLGAIFGHRKPKRRRSNAYYRPQPLKLEAEEPAVPVAAAAAPPAAILAAQPALAAQPEPAAEPEPPEAAPPEATPPEPVAPEPLAPIADETARVAESPPEAMPEPPPEPGAFPAEPLAAETTAVQAESEPEAEPMPEPGAFPAPAEEPVSPALDHGPEVDLTPAPVEALAASPVADPPPPAAVEKPAVAADAPSPASEPSPISEPAPNAEAVEAAPAPASTTDDGETFAAAREHLREAARAEDWPAAAAVLARLPRLAATDAEQAMAAQDLGTYYRSQGRTDDAAEAFENALSYARQTGDASLLAGALTDVGDVAMEEHRLDPALACYSELVELRRGAVAADNTTENRRLLSLALERLGDAREDRGHRTRALELYRESLAIAGELAASDPARYGAELTSTRQRVTELEERLAL